MPGGVGAGGLETGDPIAASLRAYGALDEGRFHRRTSSLSPLALTIQQSRLITSFDKLEVNHHSIDAQLRPHFHEPSLLPFLTLCITAG